MKKEIYHVTPNKDSKPHSISHAVPCPCKPREERQPNGNLLVIHNAWDGREFHEINDDGWVAINSVEDLPKGEGRFVVTQIYRRSPDTVEVDWFTPDDVGSIERWIDNYSAWQPFPEPYKPEGEIV